MGDFIKKIKEYCGHSKWLFMLFQINVLLCPVLWVSSIWLDFTGVGSSLLYRLFCLSGDPHTFLFHPWTLLTYMVTQFSLLHLIFNVLWIVWFGRLALFALSEKSMLALYLGGGVAGGIFYIIAGIGGAVAPGAYLVGASAAALAMMTGVAVTMPTYRVNLLLIGNVQMRLLCLICILLTFLGVGGASGVGGQTAHIGGVIFGLGYGFYKKRMSTAEKKSSDSFKAQPTMNIKSVIRLRPARKKMAEPFIRQARGRLSDPERLDELLDKIRLSGYASLSDMEKKELDAISRRLKEADNE